MLWSGKGLLCQKVIKDACERLGFHALFVQLWLKELFSIKLILTGLQIVTFARPVSAFETSIYEIAVLLYVYQYPDTTT